MEKENQHFVPQGLLRQFTIQGEKSLVWALSKSRGQYGKRPASTRNICSKRFYYYQPGQAHGIDYKTVEDNFGKVETVGASILNSIIDQKDSATVNLPQQQRGEFSFYLALLLTRGPVFRDAIHDLHGAMVQLLLLRAHANKSLPQMPAKLQEYVNAQGGIENAIQIQISPHISLRPMVLMAEQVGLSMLEKSWTFYRCSSPIPITDCPLVFFSESDAQVGPAHPHAHLLVPLHKHFFLHVRPGPNNGDQVPVEDADAARVDATRARLVAASHEHVYSSERSDALIQLCQKHRDQRQRIVLDKGEHQMWKVLDEPPEGSVPRPGPQSQER